MNYHTKLALDNGFDKMLVICRMNVLLIAATEAEIAPLIEYITANWQKTGDVLYIKGQHQLQIGITGVGMMQAAYKITKLVANAKYDIAIQAGIAGSFNRDITLGTVVQVISEQLGDLGAEDHDDYIDIFDMGFLKENSHPFDGRELKAATVPWPSTAGLTAVKSLTINTVSGNARTIERLMKSYNCDVESMEGAAFHYVCLAENIPFLQVRAISNYIEPRDRSKWQIGPAVRNLNDWLIKEFRGFEG
ncbi:MAG: futalosine hydrolase [Bacteroidetes bacterium]|nr:futalosine hydrolase [Bacteroidota bacterium]